MTRSAVVLAAFVLLAVTGATAAIAHAVRQQRYDIAVAASATTRPPLAPLTPAPPRVPKADTTADLRSLLLPPPAGATLTAPDGAFTLADVPTDLVWQSLHDRGFVRGATRQWRQADGIEVTIVLFQFQTTDEAYAFTANAHTELGHWPGCSGWSDAGEGARVYSCDAISKQDRAGWRATFYQYELAGYLVALVPGKRGTAPFTGPVEQQAALLA